MKVLLTATVQSHIVQFHKPLVEMLHAHGCEVHVAARDNLAEKNGLKLDFADKVFDVPFARSPKSPDNIKAYRQLKKIIDEGHYDVVHCNTPMGGIVTRLAARDARKQGTKVFYTAHGFHFYQGAPKKNWLVFYPIEKFFANHYTDMLLTINKEDYDKAKSNFQCIVKQIHGVGVDNSRYFPVDVSTQNQLREEFGFGENENLLLCIGELLPNKNQAMAIRMMEYVLKEHPNTHLLLAGNGPEKDTLSNMIAEYHLCEHVHMLGYCTYLEKYQRITDVLVACSKREGFGLNIVEAMLSETPIVATNNRGHRELIEEGKNGYLVDIDDHVEMARIVCMLLSDNDKRKVMGHNALLCGEKYTNQAVKKELEEIYFGGGASLC